MKLISSPHTDSSCFRKTRCVQFGFFLKTDVNIINAGVKGETPPRCTETGVDYFSSRRFTDQSHRLKFFHLEVLMMDWLWVTCKHLLRKVKTNVNPSRRICNLMNTHRLTDTFSHSTYARKKKKKQPPTFSEVYSCQTSQPNLVENNQAHSHWLELTPLFIEVWRDAEGRGRLEMDAGLSDMGEIICLLPSSWRSANCYR